MPKKKYVPPTPDVETVHGIGPDVDFSSLPVNNVTEAIHKDAAQRQEMARLRAGVTETPPSPELIGMGTTKDSGSTDAVTKHQQQQPFKANAETVQTLKSMSHTGTIRERK